MSTQNSKSSYRDLQVWQYAMDQAEAVYRLTASFPRSEDFGLTSQLRRAAASVVLNIAEGHGRPGPKDFSRFLSIARGSAKEVQTALELAYRLGYVSVFKDTWDGYDSISKMLYGLIKKLASNSNSNS